jgi:hypothetical protein
MQTTGNPRHSWRRCCLWRDTATGLSKQDRPEDRLMAPTPGIPGVHAGKDVKRCCLTPQGNRVKKFVTKA